MKKKVQLIQALCGLALLARLDGSVLLADKAGDTILPKPIDAIASDRALLPHQTDSPAAFSDCELLPFLESFDTNSMTEGELGRQNGWFVSQTNMAFLQTSIVYFATAMEQRNATAFSRTLVINASTNVVHVGHPIVASHKDIVWEDYRARPGRRAGQDPARPDKFDIAPYYVDDSGLLVVYDGALAPNNWVVLAHPPIQPHEWVRITLELNFADHTWSLWIRDAKVASNLSMANQCGEYSMFRLWGSTENCAYYDDITVSAEIPDGIYDDTDSDGLPDFWEHLYNLDPKDPTDAGRDYDSDGLTCLQEYHNRSDPHKIDTDADGLVDGMGHAVPWSVYPHAIDADNNGWIDGEWDFAASASTNDTDADGMPDGWEAYHGLNPALDDAAEDLDGDGVLNLAEWQTKAATGTARLIPANVDTDRDGLVDGTDGFVSTNDYPQGVDADGLGYVDGERDAANSSNPLAFDTDRDGLVDGRDGLISMERYPSGIDMDGDGFVDGEYDYGTSAHTNDTDADGIMDGVEVRCSRNYSIFNPTNFSPTLGFSDPDGDGITTINEQVSGSNPVDVDTDRDGLIDGHQFDGNSNGLVSIAKYPKGLDSDGNGFVDGEADCGSNPNSPDSDHDWISDGAEVLGTCGYVTNPTKADTDGDGIFDFDEIFRYKTDPTKKDTDGDGLVDGPEFLASGTGVLTVAAYPDGIDTDANGFVDGEFTFDTVNCTNDTDNDGFLDGWEVKNGSDPRDADSH